MLFELFDQPIQNDEDFNLYKSQILEKHKKPERINIIIN